jgi:hypothetical protein
VLILGMSVLKQVGYDSVCHCLFESGSHVVNRDVCYQSRARLCCQ